MASEDKFAKTIDDEQLDEVAGGTKKEIQKDIEFLNEIGKNNGIDLSQNATERKVYDAWKSLGVIGKPNSSGANEYFMKDEKFTDEVVRGSSISRQDAMIMAMRVTKKVVDLDNYL